MVRAHLREARLPRHVRHMPKATPPGPKEVGGETFTAGAGGSSSEMSPLTGLFEVKRKGRITYYTQPGGIISSLVTLEDASGDLTIHFAGLTGGTSVTDRDYLGHGSNLAFMQPEVEIPRVFDCWSYWLSEAGLCDGLADVDLLEMQVFGCQPKDVNPLTNPLEYHNECTRLREAYGAAYRCGGLPRQAGGGGAAGDVGSGDHHHVCACRVASEDFFVCGQEVLRRTDAGERVPLSVHCAPGRLTGYCGVV
eukprot:SAG11_NODE_130_length_15497_cov_10.780556_11_plen_251_part_00